MHTFRILFFSALMLPILLAGCGMFSAEDAGEETRLMEARSLWASFGFESYTFKETRTCECTRPWAYTVEVEDGMPVDLHYDRKAEDYHYESREVMLSLLRSVDQYFELLEHSMETADDLRVEYHPTYGYPTEIFIDPDTATADEEIIRTLTALDTTSTE